MGGAESKQRPRTLKYSSQLADKPSRPGKPQLVPSDKHSAQPDVVTIRWEPPFYDGGSRITGYLVEHRRTGSPHWVRSSPNLVTVPELTLSGLEPGWRYQFRVSAQNTAGLSEPGELSDLLTVTLQRTAASAPFFVKELQNTVAIENEKAELSVQVRGTPTPTIAWFKDGVEIFSSRSYRVVTDNEFSSLVIHQAAFSDEGEIKCSATNRVGYAVTRAKLTLEAPPSIRLPRQYEEGLLFEKDEVIRLKVSVAGRPAPKVSWQLNGEAVGEGGHYEATHSDRYATLRVGAARRTDRGEYQVKAVNRLGEDIASFLVTVADRPMPPGKAKVVMTLGRSVTLCWTTPEDDGGCKIGNYIVEYYRLGWNMWLKAATCRQLTTTLGELIEGSEYKFRVKAENPYGVSDPSSESDVVFIPDPKRGILEPPRHGTPEVEGSMNVWLEENKRPISTSPSIDEQYAERKTKKKRGPLAPIQVQKAGKYPGHPSMVSEDITLHPPTPEEYHPVIPKRRTKEEKAEIKKDIEEERQLLKKLEEKRKVEEFKKFEDRKKLEEQKANQFKNESSNENNFKIKKELMPTDHPQMEHDSRYGSSELMLVLLPQSRATTEERDTSKRELFESSMALEDDGIAPPMSLSAPELGNGELLDFTLVRAAYSSTELLHERSMARFYQDMEQEAKEIHLKRRSSLQRRRSFGSRTKVSEGDIAIKDDIASSRPITEKGSKTDKPTLMEKNPLALGEQKLTTEHFKNKSFSRDSIDSMLSEDLHRKSKLIQQTSEEDMEYEDSSFDEDDEYDEELVTDEELVEENEKIEDEEEYEEDEYSNDEKRGSFVYTSESEEEERRYPFSIKEDTYHPKSINQKYNEDTMISAYEGRGPLILHPVAQNPPVSLTVEDNIEDYTNTVIESNSDIINHKKHVKESTTQNQGSDVSLGNLPMFPEKRFEPNFSPVMPKPILKVREKSQEKYSPTAQRKGAPVARVEPELNIASTSKNNLDICSDHEISTKKKQVRIEEPKDIVATEQLNQKDPNIPSSSQVPPNLQRTGSPENEADAARVLISHYSDIVAEYGRGKKPPKKLYLNYEALKAAAAEEEEKESKIPVPEIVINEPEIDVENPEVLPEQRSKKSNKLSLSKEKRSIATFPIETNNDMVIPLVKTLKDELKEKSPVKKLKKRSPSPRNPKQSLLMRHDEDIAPEKTDYVRTPSPILQPRSFNATEQKVHSYLDFAMDFSLFILACWLYLFKDERLSIPVMCLMIYRQANEAFQRKMEALRNKLPKRILFWRKNKVIENKTS